MTMKAALALAPLDVLPSSHMQWFLGEMERLSEDVNDREIIRRFQLFAARTDYDFSLQTVQEIRQKKDVREDIIPEPLLPFYRHYLYMLKRKNR